MAKKMNKLSLIMAIISCIVGIVLFKHLFLLLLFGILPSIVALMVDHSPKRILSRTVLCFNLAGVLPTFSHIVLGGGGPGSLGELLGSPGIWLLIYGAAGLGWVAYWSAPVMVYSLIKADHLRARLILEMRCKKLLEEWGPEIKRRVD